jgi:RNA polymerase sigma-70 factor, ECF subfamily
MSRALNLTAAARPLDPESAEASPSEAIVRENHARFLAHLLESYLQIVWRTLRRCGVPASAADDAAQEVFMVAARKLDDIVVGREKQFLCGIAVRVAANWRRANATRGEAPSIQPLTELPSTLPGPAELLHRKRLREAMQQILEALPEDLRTAFVLFELEGFTVPEVAEVLAVPLGTAASKLRRAREAFRAAAAQLRESFTEESSR